jgi:hypothetical protein
VTIPGSTVVVFGNLSISGDLTFTGLRSSVNVEGGCAYIGGTLQIELTAEDLESISKEDGSTRALALISESSSCTSLVTVSINAKKTSSTCHKIESTTSLDATDGFRTLSAIFKVN